MCVIASSWYNWPCLPAELPAQRRHHPSRPHFKKLSSTKGIHVYTGHPHSHTTFDPILYHLWTILSCKYICEGLATQHSAASWPITLLHCLTKVKFFFSKISAKLSRAKPNLFANQHLHLAWSTVASLQSTPVTAMHILSFLCSLCRTWQQL